MKILRVLLKKEFLQISRSKFILIIMFVLPVVQLLVLPLAATYEMKNISLSVVDNDHSTYAQQLINKFTASGYFKLNDYSPSFSNLKGFLKVILIFLFILFSQPAYNLIPQELPFQIFLPVLSVFSFHHLLLL